MVIRGFEERLRGFEERPRGFEERPRGFEERPRGTSFRQRPLGNDVLIKNCLKSPHSYRLMSGFIISEIHVFHHPGLGSGL